MNRIPGKIYRKLKKMNRAPENTNRAMKSGRNS